MTRSLMYLLARKSLASLGNFRRINPTCPPQPIRSDSCKARPARAAVTGDRLLLGGVAPCLSGVAGGGTGAITCGSPAAPAAVSRPGPAESTPADQVVGQLGGGDG